MNVTVPVSISVHGGPPECVTKAWFFNTHLPEEAAKLLKRHSDHNKVWVDDYGQTYLTTSFTHYFAEIKLPIENDPSITVEYVE